MSPIFQPPTADTLPPTVPGIPGNDPVAYRLLRHFKNRAHGQTVLKTAGVYRTVEHPSQDELDAASEVYLGGHIYTVSATTAAALEAAGYTTTLDFDSGYTWGSLSALTWAEFADEKAWN